MREVEEVFRGGSPIDLVQVNQGLRGIVPRLPDTAVEPPDYSRLQHAPIIL